jgi:ABC-type transport system involved in multi-copper enzyme maturation permease subunit
MMELLKTNVLTNFIYYRRSRLLLAFMLVFLALTGLTSLPMFFTSSGVQGFNTVRQVFTVLNIFLLWFTAGTGLFIISSHLRSRSLKMVFTKPCPPWAWLLSAFISAVGVSLLLNGVILGGAVVASLIWHLPIRAGLVWVSTHTFTTSVGLIAYMMLLATVVHPAVAVAIALIFSATLFYQMYMWIESFIRAGNTSTTLHVLGGVFHYIYLALPIVGVYDEKTEGIRDSLHVPHASWKYLLYSAGYVAVLSLFCYLLSLLAFQRKRHI